MSIICESVVTSFFMQIMQNSLHFGLCVSVCLFFLLAVVFGRLIDIFDARAVLLLTAAGTKQKKNTTNETNEEKKTTLFFYLERKETTK